MSDWVGIFIILISLFCGGFALGVKWGENRYYEAFNEETEGADHKAVSPGKDDVADR